MADRGGDAAAGVAVHWYAAADGRSVSVTVADRGVGPPPRAADDDTVEAWWEPTFICHRRRRARLRAAAAATVAAAAVVRLLATAGPTAMGTRVTLGRPWPATASASRVCGICMGRTSTKAGVAGRAGSQMAAAAAAPRTCQPVRHLPARTAVANH